MNLPRADAVGLEAWLRITQSSKIVTSFFWQKGPRLRFRKWFVLAGSKGFPEQFERLRHTCRLSQRAKNSNERVFQNSALTIGQSKLNPAHVPCQWVNNPTLSVFCGARLGRADIEGSKSDVAMNAWPPQASYPCGNFSDTSGFIC